MNNDDRRSLPETTSLPTAPHEDALAALPTLDDEILDAITGGQSGGITAMDDWEAPVV